MIRKTAFAAVLFAGLGACQNVTADQAAQLAGVTAAAEACSVALLALGTSDAAALATAALTTPACASLPASAITAAVSATQKKQGQ